MLSGHLGVSGQLALWLASVAHICGSRPCLTFLARICGSHLCFTSLSRICGSHLWLASVARIFGSHLWLASLARICFVPVGKSHLALISGGFDVRHYVCRPFVGIVWIW